MEVNLSILEERKEALPDNAQEFYFKLNLQYLLKLNKIKKNQFAKEIGVSKQTIFDWLKKDPIINTQQSIKIAKYFKLSVEELFLCNLKLSQDYESSDKFDYLNKFNTPFYIIDLKNGRTFANQEFCNLLGISEHEINYRIGSDLIHPDDLPQMQILIKRAIAEKKLFSQIDIRFVTAKRGFIWMSNLCTCSLVEMKIFVFAFPLKEEVEVPLFENIRFEEFVMMELRRIQQDAFRQKKLNFVSRLDSDVMVRTDRNFLKCLLRSMFNQFQYIDFESDQNVIFLNSREENGNLQLNATINCAVNAKSLDLGHVNKIAEIIGATVSENYAGNLYSFYITFPNSFEKSRSPLTSFSTKSQPDFIS